MGERKEEDERGRHAFGKHKRAIQNDLRDILLRYRVHSAATYEENAKMAIEDKVWQLLL